jgi:hypothetical protein
MTYQKVAYEYLWNLKKQVKYNSSSNLPKKQQRKPTEQDLTAIVIISAPFWVRGNASGIQNVVADQLRNAVSVVILKC